MAAIFGIILQIKAIEGTAIFCVLICVLMMLEFMFEQFELKADRYGYTAVLEKLKKELMILGIISFIVFIYQTIDQSHSTWFLAFEMAHIIVLFMAISFIVQAAILIRYSSVGGKQLLTAVRQTFEDMITQYKHIEANQSNGLWNQFNHYVFHNSPSWAPFYPKLRYHIEYRIIEKFFLEQHELPRGFRFSKYATTLFKQYIAELQDLKPLSWLSLAVLVLFNFLRIGVIDTALKPSYCHELHNTDDHHDDGHHRLLAGGSTIDDSLKSGCLYYAALAYGLFCAFSLLIVMYSIYIAANYYYDRLIYKCLKWDKINVKAKGKQAYLNFLEQCELKERTFKELTQQSLLEFEGIDNTKNVYKSMRNGSAGKQVVSKSRRFSRDAQALQSASDHVPSPHGSRRPQLKSTKRTSIYQLGDLYNAQVEVQMSISEYKMVMDNIKFRKEHDRELLLTRPFLVRLRDLFFGESNESESSPLVFPSKNSVKRPKNQEIHEKKPEDNDDEEEAPQISAEQSYEDVKQISKIFLFQSPKLFFKCVELGLLFQCFYISIWSTQLIPLATYSSEATKYIILLTIPIAITVVLLISILRKTVLLQTVISLHPAVVDIVCDQTMDETTAIVNIRHIIRDRLKEKTLDQKQWRNIVQAQFDEYDLDGNGEMDAQEFRNFLGTMNIFMPKERFDMVWESIDYDLSGAITWDELFVIVFPEYQYDVMSEMHLLQKMRDALRKKLSADQVPKLKWRSYLYGIFQEFDVDNSEFIEKDEFAKLLKSLGLHEFSEQQFHMLFQVIDTDSDGEIGFSDFAKALRLHKDYSDDLSIRMNDVYGANNVSTGNLRYEDKPTDVVALNKLNERPHFSPIPSAIHRLFQGNNRRGTYSKDIESQDLDHVEIEMTNESSHVPFSSIHESSSHQHERKVNFDVDSSNQQ